MFFYLVYKLIYKCSAGAVTYPTQNTWSLYNFALTFCNLINLDPKSACVQWFLSQWETCYMRYVFSIWWSMCNNVPTRVKMIGFGNKAKQWTCILMDMFFRQRDTSLFFSMEIARSCVTTLSVVHMTYFLTTKHRNNEQLHWLVLWRLASSTRVRRQLAVFIHGESLNIGNRATPIIRHQLMRLLGCWVYFITYD